MSTQNWIKTTDKFPTDTDLPVWVYRAGRKTVSIWRNALFASGSGWQEYTHWRPAAADIPAPPKEETQEDKDEAAWLKWSLSDAPFAPRSKVWHTALAYERAEVAKLLPSVHAAASASVGGGYGEYVAAVAAIRARCGGAK